MGSGASANSHTTLQEEANKPTDASDLVDLDAARQEVTRLRQMARQAVQESPNAASSLDTSQRFDLVPADAPITDPHVALQRLKDGNLRFIQGAARHPNTTRARRRSVTVEGQKPFATILGCSDSRAPTPLIFDVGIGDLFCISVAGNVTSHTGLASMEYGVKHLGTPLLLVLGHKQCGAVTAVVKQLEVEGMIPRLLDIIKPAFEKAIHDHPNSNENELRDHTITTNVFLSVETILTYSSIIRELVEEGKLLVEGAEYDIDGGQVEWLGPHPEQAQIIKDAHAGTKDMRNTRVVVAAM